MTPKKQLRQAMKLRDVEFKYKISSYRMAKLYPEKKDLIFDIIRYVLSTNKKKKRWVLEEFSIDMKDLSQAIPLMSNAEVKPVITALLVGLLSEGYLMHSGEKVALSKDALEMFYEL
jgi:hypothetical protein